VRCILFVRLYDVEEHPQTRGHHGDCTAYGYAACEAYMHSTPACDLNSRLVLLEIAEFEVQECATGGSPQSSARQTNGQSNAG